MTTAGWVQSYTASIPGADETVVATIPTGNVTPTEMVALFVRVLVANPDGDASESNIRIRRGTIAGDVVATPAGQSGSGTADASAGFTLGPFFDGPGIASSRVYVLTIEQVDATGPSTEITAVLGVQPS